MKTIIMQLVRKAQSDGNRVFVANNGTGDYGLITNQDGTKVITFWPSDFDCGMSFATDYVAKNPTRFGQGEVIAQNRYEMDKINTTEYLNRNVWTPDHRPKTLEEHLAFYQTSSKYREML